MEPWSVARRWNYNLREIDLLIIGSPNGAQSVSDRCVVRALVTNRERASGCDTHNAQHNSTSTRQFMLCQQASASTCQFTANQDHSPVVNHFNMLL